MLQGDMKKGGETITYGRNHMIAGFNPSCGKWTYIAMQRNLNYGEWVWYGISGFQLVHSMLLGERDSLPLGLAHDGCALCLSFGVFEIWLHVAEIPWKRPPNCEVCFVGFIHLHIVWFNVSECGHTYHPPFCLCFSGAERE